MTAEIAILNKASIALATDSALTISESQGSNIKGYDSADKLFEISNSQPVGLMIYNAMEFAEFPFPVLIKSFRDECSDFDTVEEYGNEFLKFLNKAVKNSSIEIRNRLLKSQLASLLLEIQTFIEKRAAKVVLDNVENDVREIMDAYLSELLGDYIYFLSQHENALFLNDDENFVPSLCEQETEIIDELINDIFSAAVVEDYKDEIMEICELGLIKDFSSPSLTGLVFAGFGKTEKFPSLHAYEVEGFVNGYLKYRKKANCDIDRDGDQAKVMPFAQKQMVDRFLYGLDDSIEKEIKEYCDSGVSVIGTGILENVNFSNDDEKRNLQELLKENETFFFNTLKTKVFSAIRDGARKEINDLVAVMPKAEIARMAEALIELTSIKHRISIGLETVGGPVDVAVITKAEGFVWVKRKHYFPREINSRYFERLRTKLSNNNSKEENHDCKE